MPGLIKANRAVVDQRHSLLGFTVRTGEDPWFEVVLAADPKLFAKDQIDQRTASNFYSTRGVGPLPAEQGRAVYMVPPEVMLRFVGQDRLYYTIATFPDSSRSHASFSRIPEDALSPVRISPDFGAGSVRALIGLRNRRARMSGRGAAYTEPGYLTWSGDLVENGGGPGLTPATSPPGSNGGTSSPVAGPRTPSPAPGSPSLSPGPSGPPGGTPAPETASPSPTPGPSGPGPRDQGRAPGPGGDGAPGANGEPAARPASPETGAESQPAEEFQYDDGLDASFWQHARHGPLPESGGGPFNRSGGGGYAPAQATHALGGAMNGTQTMRYPTATQQGGPVAAAGAIAGIAFDYITSNEGGVTWNLAQWRGIKNPAGGQAGPSTYQNGTMDLSSWPKAATVGGLDEIYLPIEVRWQYNGRSVGNIEILPGRANDAAFAGLHVEGLIMDDANVYPSQNDPSVTVAAIKVSLTYRFTNTFWRDLQARYDITLYGDGGFARRGRWL